MEKLFEKDIEEEDIQTLKRIVKKYSNKETSVFGTTLECVIYAFLAVYLMDDKKGAFVLVTATKKIADEMQQRLIGEPKVSQTITHTVDRDIYKAEGILSHIDLKDVFQNED